MLARNSQSKSPITGIRYRDDRSRILNLVPDAFRFDPGGFLQYELAGGSRPAPDGGDGEDLEYVFLDADGCQLDENGIEVHNDRPVYGVDWKGFPCGHIHRSIGLAARCKATLERDDDGLDHNGDYHSYRIVGLGQGPEYERRALTRAERDAISRAMARTRKRRPSNHAHC